MGGAIGGVISSVAEGVSALGKSIKEASEGDWDEAGEQFARAGLEAAGIVGSIAAGPAGGAVESIQEGIEGALDSAGLEGGTEDVSAPGGEGANFELPGMLSGAVSGVLGGIGGGGGAGGALGKILGAVGGGGGVGSGLQDLLGGVLGESQIADFSTKMADFGEASEMLQGLADEGSDVADKVLNASV